MQKRYVTASELAEYVYCQCCWMDTLEGKRETTFEMMDGTASHEKIHGGYLISKYLKKIAFIIIAAVVLLLLLEMFLQFAAGGSLW